MLNLSIDHPDYELATPAQHTATFARLKAEMESASAMLTTRFSLGRMTEMAIFSNDENALVGSLDYALREKNNIVAVHVWIAPPFRERGHAANVGKAFVRTCFNQGCHRIETAHLAGDVAAARLAQRLGFLPEGIQRSALRVDRKWIDLAHYGRLVLD